MRSDVMTVTYPGPGGNQLPLLDGNTGELVKLDPPRRRGSGIAWPEETRAVWRAMETFDALRVVGR